MKILFPILFFLLLSTKLISQNSISMGFKTSYYNSNIHFYNNFFPQNIKTSPLDNFNLSFITEIKNEKNTGIRIEVSKIKKGWAFDQENNINNNLYQSEFDFINIPFMMTTYFGDKNLNINFALGPFAEFMISDNSDKIKLNFPDEPFYFDEERDNIFSYGLVAMGGLSFNLNKNQIQLLVSYQYNFDNIFDIVIKNQSIPDISNFNTLSFSLVYLRRFIKNDEF